MHWRVEMLLLVLEFPTAGPLTALLSATLESQFQSSSQDYFSSRRAAFRDNRQEGLCFIYFRSVVPTPAPVVGPHWQSDAVLQNLLRVGLEMELKDSPHSSMVTSSERVKRPRPSQENSCYRKEWLSVSDVTRGQVRDGPRNVGKQASMWVLDTLARILRRAGEQKRCSCPLRSTQDMCDQLAPSPKRSKPGTGAPPLHSPTLTLTLNTFEGTCLQFTTVTSSCTVQI